MRDKIELGDQVRDPITGVQGIAMAVTVFLHGCARVAILQKAKKDGTVLPSVTIDEPQLEVIKRKKVPKGNSKIGGPEKFRDPRLP